MNRRMSVLLLAGILAVVFASGCAKKEIARCTTPEDNPQHHYLMGMKALEDGKLDVAEGKFDRAVYCDEKFSPAYSGLAIVTAEKAKKQPDVSFKKVETERAVDYLKKAKKLSKTDEDRFDYLMATIRVYTALKSKDWLEKAEDALNEGNKLKVDERRLIYYQGKEAINYFMGVAYLEALEFQKARDSFADVLNAKREGKWHEKADKAWKKTDKIVRAMAGITVGDVGKKIAIKDTITRGDLAALLIDELKIDKLFAGRIPVQYQIEKMKAEFIPADVLNHQFKDEILTIMKWKIRGLEPKYDETTKAYLFKPIDVVKRGEMAFILEDVLIKLTGDEKIATAYFGHEKSPFPDVRPTSPFYNAVMNMTSRGIMEGELSGEFRADATVDGAEALLAMRVLRQKMNIY
ncbi:MAG: S-layer homology domain-containing protein [Thermodesulfovibrionales bacterium]|nr:S-layer homology domain-containing protein [Thermodesulfovibrionales bacterium]